MCPGLRPFPHVVAPPSHVLRPPTSVADCLSLRSLRIAHPPPHWVVGYRHDRRRSGRPLPYALLGPSFGAASRTTSLARAAALHGGRPVLHSAPPRPRAVRPGFIPSSFAPLSSRPRAVHPGLVPSSFASLSSRPRAVSPGFFPSSSRVTGPSSPRWLVDAGPKWPV